MKTKAKPGVLPEIDSVAAKPFRADNSPAANDEQLAAYRWISPTYYNLLAEFGTGNIPLVDMCLKYLGMDGAAAKRKACLEDLPFPVFRVGGQKGPWMIDAKAMANYLDEEKLKATKRFLSR